MATKVKPSRLQVSGTPQAGQVPVYVNEDTFQWGAGGGGGSGDVSGPSSSTDGDIALFDGATGKIIKDGGKSLTSLESDISANTTAISTINGKIPNAATSSNQLADKNYVNDSINSVTAYYVTKDAQGNQWASYAELAAATTFYSGGAVRVPTRNDYTVVLDDETHNNATTRYSYQGSGWQYQYTVHDTPLTQAQLDALNSGITAAKVSTYDGYVYDIADKQDELVSGVNIRTINGTSILGSGDITTPVGPTYSAGTGISLANDTITNTGVTSVNGQTGAVTVEPGKTKIFELADTSDLTTAQEAYNRFLNGGMPIIKMASGASGYRHFLAFANPTEVRFSSYYRSDSSSSTNVFYDTAHQVKFTISSGTVTAISQFSQYIHISNTTPPNGVDGNIITLVI